MADQQAVNFQPSLGGQLQLVQGLLAQARQQQLRKSSGSSNVSVVQLNSSPGAAVVAGSAPQLASIRSTPKPTYTYKVRIINPLKKSEVSTRYLNEVSSRIDSVNGLRLRIREEFGDQVSTSSAFNVGYLEQQAKISLFTSDDLSRMYEQYAKGGQITLWCDGTVSDSNCKRKDDSGTSKRTENEQQVNDVYKDLRDKHGSEFETPKLRLLARMICSGLHDDYNSPPDVPMFSSQPATKKPRKEPLSEVLSSAAIAIVKSLDKSNDHTKVSSGNPSMNAPGLSPGKSGDLRMKNYEQLRYLKQLYEDGILDDKEYFEQRQSILSTLRKLNQ